MQLVPYDSLLAFSEALEKMSAPKGLGKKRPMPPKKRGTVKRTVKHGDEAACVRGIVRHRGRSEEDASKICKAHKGLQANKSK